MQTIRTFVAVEASDEVRAAVGRLVNELRGGDSPKLAAMTGGKQAADRESAKRKSPSARSSTVTWVTLANLHFTMNFLGDVAVETVPEACQAVELATRRHQRFEVEVRGAGAFPNPQRPRTLWVGVERGRESMQLLQADIEAELEKLGFRRENRNFEPHLTIARVRVLARGDNLPQRLAEARDFAAGTMSVADVVVFASELGPGGSTYTPLSRARLCASSHEAGAQAKERG